MKRFCSYCGDTPAQLVQRTIRGGSLQFVWQCQQCGSAVGNAVSRAQAVELMGTADLPLFDECTRASYAAQQARLRQEEQAQRQHEGQAIYAQYLASPEWAAIRSKVMRRAAGVCEGCADAEPNEVHHLTYENVGAEFMFELVALCGPCHRRIHDDGAGGGQ